LIRIVRRFVRFGQERAALSPPSWIIVVADTSPINYLILIGMIDLLRSYTSGFLFHPLCW